MKWWWLSFCDPHRPPGAQFLGACLVAAHSFVEAVEVARLLGCNPGGAVQGQAARGDFTPKPGWAERLLTREECSAFDEAHS